MSYVATADGIPGSVLGKLSDDSCGMCFPVSGNSKGL